MMTLLMVVIKSKDVERTVGINCRYLGALQTSQLSSQDRLFLIEVSLTLSVILYLRVTDLSLTLVLSARSHPTSTAIVI